MDRNVRHRGIELIREFWNIAPHGDQLTLEERRAQYDRAATAFPLPSGCSVQAVSIGGIEAEWVRPSPRFRGAVILYLHGGGYVLGSPRSHRHLAAAIAGASRASAFVPQYRRAPEHPFPGAVDDAVAAFVYLLEQGYSARSIAIGGDSAGGGLALACLVRLRDAAMPLPAAAICLSPWVDLTCSSPTYTTNARNDPVLRRDDLRAMAAAYLGTASAKEPCASPLYADLRGLPDLLIHIGRDELLLDDAVSLAARARAAQVQTTLEIAAGMVHVWHWYTTLLDEAETAVSRIGEFVRSKVTTTPDAPRAWVRTSCEGTIA